MDLIIQANAVARIDSLEFLSDVVPKTQTYGEYKRQKAERLAKRQELQNGQTTLDASPSLPKRPTEVIDVDEESPDQQEQSVAHSANGHVEIDVQHRPQSNGDPEALHQPQTNGDSRHDDPEDVEMS